MGMVVTVGGGGSMCWAWGSLGGAALPAPLLQNSGMENSGSWQHSGGGKYI